MPLHLWDLEINHAACLQHAYGSLSSLISCNGHIESIGNNYDGKVKKN